jgi:uncharacterized protein
MSTPAPGVHPGAETPSNERQPLPDQLRGVALLGIAVVNTPFLAISINGYTPESTVGTLDRLTAFAMVAFAQGKFYLLFSFLFGYSLTLLLRRPGVEGLRRYRRRLVGLAVLGILHGVFFFLGDILLSYAILGAALLFFLPRSDRFALRTAAVSYVVALALLTLVVVSVAGEPPGTSVEAFDGSGALDEALGGSFLDGAAARAQALPGALLFLALFNYAQVFAMFLLGLVAGRRGLLATPERFRTLWTRLLALAAVVGVPLGVTAGLLAHGPGEPTVLRDVLSAAISFGSAPALTGGYVAAIALLTHHRALRLFVPAGRMSLTGYLGESIIMSAIFCGWGLGWFGRLGAFRAALVGLAVWAALDLFAHLWLKRYRFGPFEWTLRAWTYRELPTNTLPANTLRRGAPSATPAGAESTAQRRSPPAQRRASTDRTNPAPRATKAPDT